MSGIRLRLAAVPAIALLVSSCGFGPFAGCDAAGCDSAIAINLTGADIQSAETYRVELCVGDVCLDETISIDIPHPGPVELGPGEVDPDAAGAGNSGYGSGELIRGESSVDIGGAEARILLWAEEDRLDFYLPPRDYADSEELTLILRDSSGSVLADIESAAVPLERWEPNGRWCPPVCFWGEFTI